MTKHRWLEMQNSFCPCTNNHLHPLRPLGDHHCWMCMTTNWRRKKKRNEHFKWEQRNQWIKKRGLITYVCKCNTNAQRSFSYSHTARKLDVKRLKLSNICQDIWCITPVQRVLDIGVAPWIVCVVFSRKDGKRQQKVKEDSHHCLARVDDNIADYDGNYVHRSWELEFGVGERRRSIGLTKIPIHFHFTAFESVGDAEYYPNSCPLEN